MVRFVNAQSVDRIIYSIFPALQPGMENPHPPRFYTSSLTSPFYGIQRATKWLRVYNERKYHPGKGGSAFGTGVFHEVTPSRRCNRNAAECPPGSSFVRAGHHANSGTISAVTKQSTRPNSPCGRHEL